MTPDQYQQQALRTASTALGPDMEMAVRALGLCGETSELSSERDPDAIEKEAGDVLWYVATLASSAGITMSEILGPLSFSEFQVVVSVQDPDLAPEEKLMEAAGRVAEAVKKKVGHGKSLDRTRFIVDLSEVMDLVARITDLYYINLDSVADGNVKKLQARYPSGFDVEISSNL